MIIEKKTWPEFFQEILGGKKGFDVRLGDFDCAAGDTIVFREWDPVKQEYTGRVLEKNVTYVMRTKGKPYWNQDDIDLYGFQVISFT